MIEAVQDAVEGAFDVAEESIYPLELGVGDRLALDAHVVGVVVAARFERVKTGEAIGMDYSVGSQVSLRPSAEDSEGEGLDTAENHELGMVLGIGLDGGQDGHLISTAPAGTLTVAGAAEVGVIQLDSSLQLARFLRRGGAGHQFVLEKQRRLVIDTELPVQLQGAELGLRLAEEQDGQIPGAQGQASVLKERADVQAFAVTASVTLPVRQVVRATGKAPRLRAAALSTVIALGPFAPLKILATRRLIREVPLEFKQPVAALKLNLIASHKCLQSWIT